MSEHQKNSNQYSAADVQRYLSGQMSAEEMHAMETAALDDPFLADAIEGYEHALKSESEEKIKYHLQSLNRNLEKRVRKSPTRVVPLYQSTWWKISAAAAAVIVISLAIYNNWMASEQRSKTELAIQEKRQADTVRGPEIATNAAPEQERLQQQALKQATPLLDSQPKDTLPGKSSNRETQPIAPKSNQKVTQDVVYEAPVRTDNEIEARRQPVSISPVVAEKEKPEEKKDVAAAANTEDLKKRNNQLSAQLNNFSGLVVDKNNNPLAYANVQVSQNKMNLVTDQAGHFKFEAQDSIVDVQVAMTGFEQRNFRLQNNISSNKLVLEPTNQALDEVVVTGYGAPRKRSAEKLTGKVQDAQPINGWIEYEKYLETNKKPPSSNPLLKGESVISFFVKKPGGLSDFKVEKSLSADHDAEAIRLIREGPTWKVPHGRKARVTVIVKF